jgi:hypothetical protein
LFVEEIAEASSILEEPRRMILKQNSINEEIDGQYITTLIPADGNLKCQAILKLEMRYVALQKLRTYRLRARTELNTVRRGDLDIVLTITEAVFGFGILVMGNVLSLFRLMSAMRMRIAGFLRKTIGPLC